MNKDIEATLHKLRRRATAMLKTQQVIAALAELGWQAEKTAFVKLIGGETTDVREYDEERARRKHDYLSDLVVGAVPGTGAAKANRDYVLNLSEIKRRTHKRDRAGGGGKNYSWEFTYEGYRKVNGHRLTAPDGLSFDIYGSTATLGKGSRGTGALLRWAFENTDLEEQICRKLSLPKHVPVWERPREPVGDQLLGFCAICGSEQVTHDGRMVLHGYRRPGYGWIEGRCFGVGHLAYNLSHEACDAYLPVMAAERSHTAEYLTRLEADKVDSLNEIGRRYGEEPRVLQRADPGFEKLRLYWIDQQKRLIAATNRERGEMRRKIANWQPKPLRGTN